MAVARGAVIFGMHPSKIATRIPRFWYGIEITNIFDPNVDPIEYKVVRPDGSVRCDNRFSTYVERGKPLGRKLLIMGLLQRALLIIQHNRH